MKKNQTKHHFIGNHKDSIFTNRVQAISLLVIGLATKIMTLESDNL